jgi:hypothetical protein
VRPFSYVQWQRERERGIWKNGSSVKVKGNENDNENEEEEEEEEKRTEQAGRANVNSRHGRVGERLDSLAVQITVAKRVKPDLT